MDDVTPLYALIHIPKAAGKTLRWIAKRQYGPEAELKLPKNEWRHALREGLPDGLRLITDVPMVGVHEQVERPIRYVTMLRHPVQRLLSYYRYDRPDGDFSDFTVGRLVRNNAMTRALAGVERAREPVTAATLQIARTNLQEHFAWVGVSELFDECLVLAKHSLGWRNILYRSRNVSRGRSRYIEPPPDVIRQIEADNVYDLELYASVRQQLELTIAAQGPRFLIEVQALKRLLAAETGEMEGLTHEKPSRLHRNAYRRHVRELVRMDRVERVNAWRLFQSFVEEFARDWRR